ncbi:MAG: transcription elongation factor GreA [Clostridia bacterium]|nr:transcription elongation factor GreA [Clostridia bacterium]MBQ2273183.1 transcription elongation factor GreA [Clostridia bacterium]MBQ5820513.1 transcription elongation factor GreA [Clostridia bacterium]
MSQPIFLTREGLTKLEEELHYLKATKRGEVAERIKEARGFGDLSENSEYDAACEESAMVEARIRTLEEQLKLVQVVDNSEMKNDLVHIGSTVRLLDYEFDEEVEYSIVGMTESNPAENKISDQSPVGKTLLGHRVGDTVVVSAPGGEYTYKILAIVLSE